MDIYQVTRKTLSQAEAESHTLHKLFHQILPKYKSPAALQETLALAQLASAQESHTIAQAPVLVVVPSLSLDANLAMDLLDLSVLAAAALAADSELVAATVVLSKLAVVWLLITALQEAVFLQDQHMYQVLNLLDSAVAHLDSTVQSVPPTLDNKQLI